MARLAAFDMDGTLLMPDHHLGEKTLSTLARLRERDITLTFATGRHALEMQHILGALSLEAYLITGNGTRVHSLEGELLHRDDLPADVGGADTRGLEKLIGRIDGEHDDRNARDFRDRRLELDPLIGVLQVRAR